jgi:hypothetical protein
MRVTRWFATALIMALVAGLWGSPAAQAAESWSPLQLSWRGQAWHTHLDRALFRHTTMIPGQTTVRSFYVRNRGDSAANMIVRVRLNDPNGWAASRSFRLAVGHDNDWQRITADGARGARFAIPQGGTDQIKVRTRFLPTATGSQLRSFSFDLRLRLTHKGP